ncbi:hypothetical protein [Streptomyces sp. NPDC059278]|uniref:hypothetical protein n=1 Tax=Streptomyces sp. NPDC059278 TaxID=3346801 RepID=UPI0036C85005
MGGNPAVRRLSMTARVWKAEGGVPRLIAGMDEDSKVFGPVAFKAMAAGVLRFSKERDPAVPDRFVRLRVIEPEGTYWGVDRGDRTRVRETGCTARIGPPRVER